MNEKNSHATVAISDEEIIKRVLSGEKDLYALIVRKYNQRLYRIAMAIINDDEEVEDVMQEAYIQAYENLKKFAYRSSFSTWLIRILINECLHRLKKRKQSFRINDESFKHENYHMSSSYIQTPLTKLIGSELNRVLEVAISQLPEKYRAVFIMRELEEMNVAETKECLGISEINVKVRLNRAKALLRNSLTRLYKKEDILHFQLHRCARIAENVVNRIKAI